MGSSSLADDVETLCQTALQEPTEGVTLWAFHTRDVDRALEPEEVLKLIASGKGVYLVELVWDDGEQLVQRGPGRTIRRATDLRKLIRDRVQHLSDHGSDRFG